MSTTEIYEAIFMTFTIVFAGLTIGFSTLAFFFG